MEYEGKVDFETQNKRVENAYIIFFSILIAGSLGYLFLVPQVVPVEITSEMTVDSEIEFNPYNDTERKVTVLEAVKIEVLGCERYLPEIDGYDLDCGISFLTSENNIQP